MKTFTLTFALFALSLFAVGCEKSGDSNSGTPETHSPKDGHDHGADEHEGHDHAADDHSAKHGGHLIEVGPNHEYHAELVDDHTTESITIYTMDAHMEPLIVKQASISLTLTAGDKTQTFELLSDQPGGSSEFKSSDQVMMGMLETEGVNGKLRITIDEKPFSGTFDHHAHGHEESDDSHAH